MALCLEPIRAWNGRILVMSLPLHKRDVGFLSRLILGVIRRIGFRFFS